jgi:uncharacterized protein YutE (UPF0331/DUF86 family)
MVDKALILAKASTVKRYRRRVADKSKVDLQTFKSDQDLQEIVLFNLQMAIQNCIDIAAHIISEEGYGIPGSSNEMFYLLEENGLVDTALTDRMVQAVGLRNLIVHEYGRIDIGQIYHVARHDIGDLDDFIKAILEKIA